MDGVGTLHQRKGARVEQKGQRPVDADEHQVVFLHPLADGIRHLAEQPSADQRFPDGIAADVRKGENDSGDIIIEHMDLGHESARDQTGP